MTFIQKHDRDCSVDAERFNTPKHWGKALEEGAEIDGDEIKPITEPRIRRVKARRILMPSQKV